ncbi:hypothetical protein ACLF6K_19385 [Streptomyces xanthophaeus]|uniref:hypothetical protein n=1 Tax=Streptomyces xanthophaeus TaxID=67385 RepID=UPI0039900EAF
MIHPVNRNLLLLDIERYSDRDDVAQAYLRRMLYGVIDQVLLAAEIDATLRRRSDRGDGLIEVIDANAPLDKLLRVLLTEVPAQLRAVNRLASSSAQIRLRAVLATGYVDLDELGGEVGSDLNHACRLLDGEVLRAALRESADDFALCVSERVHEAIVHHHHLGIPAERFTGITVPSKNGPLRAWLYGPLPKGGPAPETEGASGARTGLPADPAPASPAPARTPPAASGGTRPAYEINGGQFGGTNWGISGGTFNGDIHLGGGDRR